MKRAWLLTAFEPFAGRTVNNSQNVLSEIQKLAQEKSLQPNWNFDFHYKILPTEYDHCFNELMNEVQKLKKSGIELEGILSLGEGAEEFKVETQANNLDDVPGYPDNKGVARVAQKIFPDLLAEELLPLRFPFEAFARIRTSTNAGYFICNHLCARMSREYAAKHLPYFGFIHVPVTGQGGVFTPDVCGAMIVNSFGKF